ncbi:cytochrome-c peroxidase [Corallococcus sp. 4LFB]|uniref:cytochrome-c peroxidase n=1 Tax=Corallococcus sp. 4LFB TaxID=3383249 RepID=UPI00397503C6
MRLPPGVVTVLAVVLNSGVGLAASPPSRQAPSAPPPLPPGVSATLWRGSVPRGLEPTPERVALGKKLFRDKRLSVDHTVACMTCHEPEFGFTDGKPLADGDPKMRAMEAYLYAQRKGVKVEYGKH